MAKRSAWLWHPPHRWRGIRLDRSRLWPMVTLGWLTVEVLPAPIATRVIALLATLSRSPPPIPEQEDRHDRTAALAHHD